MAQWRITDGNYYIDPSGNDLNPGTQAAPFATLGKFWSLNLVNQKVVVGAGLYIETGTVRANNFVADQYGSVIVDQAGFLLSPWTRFGGGILYITGFIIRNFTGVRFFQPSTTSNQQFILTDCRYINNTTPTDLCELSGLFQFTRSLIVDSIIGGVTTNYNYRGFISQTSVINSNIICQRAGASRIYLYHSFIDANSTLDAAYRINEHNAVTLTNRFPNNINGTLRDNTTGGVFVDLATYKLNSTDLDESVDVAPGLNAKALFGTSELDVSLDATSPMRTLSNIGNYIGYAREATSLNNTDPEFDIAADANVIAGAVVKVGTEYELDGVNEATIESGIIELNGFDSRVLERLRVEGFENPFLAPNFEVFDDTNTALDNPNWRTLEMRWADPLDIYPPSTTIGTANWYKFRWNEKPQYDPINDVGSGDILFNTSNATNIQTKFVQLRVTFRDNGVI